MTNRSTNEEQRSTHHTSISFRQLLNEVHVLIGSLPDLRDAIDPDELPIAFILERDAPRASDSHRKQPSDE
jgi:hypothetical protein